MQRADTKIEGVLVCDGTGAPLYPADVAVRDDRIAAVGDLAALPAGVTVAGHGGGAGAGFHRRPHP